jgi:hypothetical protein
MFNPMQFSPRTHCGLCRVASPMDFRRRPTPATPLAMFTSLWNSPIVYDIRPIARVWIGAANAVAKDTARKSWRYALIPDAAITNAATLRRRFGCPRPGVCLRAVGGRQGAAPNRSAVRRRTETIRPRPSEALGTCLWWPVAFLRRKHPRPRGWQQRAAAAHLLFANTARLLQHRAVSFRPKYIIAYAFSPSRPTCAASGRCRASNGGHRHGQAPRCIYRRRAPRPRARQAIRRRRAGPRRSRASSAWPEVSVYPLLAEAGD